MVSAFNKYFLTEKYLLINKQSSKIMARIANVN